MTNRELRLALAMRGGVSLAVWIGGTCAEIDRLRRPATGSLWQRLLHESGYDSVAVDIMAGASAGGLNGVIYAASQVYGFPMDQLKGLWVELGDTDKLLRKKKDPDEPGWPSFFRGDTYFYSKVEQNLRKLVAGGVAPQDPPPIALRLSATLVEPIRRPGRSPADEQLTHLRFASGFRFDNPHYAWLASSFPTSPDTATQEPPWSSRLALAARSTSSFPAAFEAAKITSTRPRSFGDTAVDAGMGRDVDMGGVFLERGAPVQGDAGFLVSDGGIVDNIPLGRALDAIAHAAADRPTDRHLIYIQPGVPTKAENDTPTSDQDSLSRRRSSVNVLKGLLGARLRAEDIIGDLQQLDDYNTRVERAASMRRSVFQEVDGPDKLLEAATRTWTGYRQLRAGEDERLVSSLLDDPIGFLGDDPFPTHVGGQAVSNSRWRSPLDDPRHGPEFTAPSRERLAVVLTAEFTNRLPSTFPDPGATGSFDAEEQRVVCIGAGPLQRICQLLIEWAQYRERFDPGASAEKARLYRVATFIREAIERPRRLAWPTLAATLPAGVSEEDLVARTAVLSDLVKVPKARADEICDALLTDKPAVLSAAIQQQLSVLDQLPNRALKEAEGPQGSNIDLRAAILSSVLVPIAQKLRSGQKGEESMSSAATPAHVGWYLDRVMPETITATHVEALEVVTYPEFAAGLPGRQPISFRRLSSANPTPLAPRFVALLNAADKSGDWWDGKNKDFALQEGIHVNLKLAGNELSNFSAFLDAEWRTNDWIWGRLDAVPTLVELLVTPELLAGVPDNDVAQVTWLEDLVLGPDVDAPMRRFLAAEVLSPETRDGILEDLKSGQPRGLRKALIAARQWEIIADELCGDELASEPAALTRQLLGAVTGYGAGAEDLRSQRISKEVRKRLSMIGDAASEVALYSAQLEPWGAKLGSPDRPSLMGRGLRRLVRLVGREAARRATRS